jgi:hypothetical protein
MATDSESEKVSAPTPPPLYGVIEGENSSTPIDDESIKNISDEELFIMVMTRNLTAVGEYMRRYDVLRAEQKNNPPATAEEGVA